MTKNRFILLLRQYAAAEARSKKVSYRDQVDQLVALMEGANPAELRRFSAPGDGRSEARRVADVEFVSNGKPTVAEARVARRPL